jgi:tetratricopeptide (TPR) repeat protein
MKANLHPVTEAEIEAAESYSAKREFAKSLNLAQEMLKRTEASDLRMRLIFGVVLCSSMLDLSEARDCALRELDTLPQPEELRALANLNRAFAENELGRPANALQILETSLQTGFFDKKDWRIHRYRCLFLKGVSLTALKRLNSALECLEAAHSLYPNDTFAGDEAEHRIFRQTEPSLQIERANCFLGLGRFEDSYSSAETVRGFEDPELATLALQYMAECRVWQGRVPEALEIYADLKKRLPCRLVDEARVQQGITNCMNDLEKRRGSVRSS